MDENDREAVALFRYGLIAPLLHGSVQDRGEYLAEVSSKVYQVPHYGTMEYSPKTIQGWLSAYQKEGLDGLKPRSRSDRGKPRVIPLEARQKILELREGNTQVPATVFYQQLVETGVFKPQDVSYCTVYRFLKRLGLVGKRPRKEPERKRFAMDKVNELWQADLSCGPYLRVGKKKLPTYLFAFIDDASRLVPFAGFTLDESFDSLKVVFKEALARLKYLVDARGFGALVGESGSGKTYALRTLADGLNPALYKVMYLPLSSGTTMDMYRSIAAGLGEEPRFRKSDLFRQIQRSVEHLFNEKRVTPVFILDEMHLARPDFLLDLAMIFNFSMDSRNPFVLVIAGLPFLTTRLRLNQTQPLAQRVIVHYKMEPMDKDEVFRYVAHHLRLAGASTEVFTEQALEAIASNSGGWPRLVNNLARTSLLLGAQLKQNPIDAETVRLASADASL